MYWVEIAAFVNGRCRNLGLNVRQAKKDILCLHVQTKHANLVNDEMLEMSKTRVRPPTGPLDLSIY